MYIIIAFDRQETVKFTLNKLSVLFCSKSCPVASKLSNGTPLGGQKVKIPSGSGYFAFQIDEA